MDQKPRQVYYALSSLSEASQQETETTEYIMETGKLLIAAYAQHAHESERMPSVQRTGMM